METPDASEVQIAAEQGLQKLIAGNQRFVRGQAKFPTVCKETLADLAREQKPFATILGCSWFNAFTKPGSGASSIVSKTATRMFPALSAEAA